ncbi:hypothetical protein [Paracoccus litorisediminis]|uniref:Uncharacterized protein n=1 Tax=Paracoccus litorisediminis TaxID=2006130 RepID=A0A844HQH9_9RHOB|nr:hypothetical protein [Paracoccus litorisediminis]MTH62140.1 hypothetical protein [Paracoccus litorisediminis]
MSVKARNQSDAERARVRAAKRKILEAGQAAGLTLRQIAIANTLDLGQLSSFAKREGFNIPTDRVTRGSTPSADAQVVTCQSWGETREHRVKMPRMAWIDADELMLAPRPDTAPRMPTIRQPMAEDGPAPDQIEMTIATIRAMRDEMRASAD